MGRWLLYTLGRVLVVIGETLFFAVDRGGWALINRFGTKAQNQAFLRRRFLEFVTSIQALDNAVAQVQARRQPVSRPPEGLN
jgi:hypothetical protein